MRDHSPLYAPNQETVYASCKFIGAELHIVQNIRHIFTFDDLLVVQRPVFFKCYVNRVGVAEQVVQVSKNFLICTCEKNAKGVGFSRLQGVYPQRVFGSTMGTNEGVDPSIRVTCEVFKRRIAVGLLIQAI